MRRLKTLRRPPIYPMSPGHLPCSSLTPPSAALTPSIRVLRWIRAKADEAKREAFVAAYAALLAEAQQVGAKVFFADVAHFRADADLRGKWVLKGEPALVDSSSPR